MAAQHGPDDHAWSPVDGEQGRYACVCGAAGWRHLASGLIRVAKTQRKAHPTRTVGLSNARSRDRLFNEPNSYTNDPDRR